jgi:hypothetical protein
MGRCMVDFELDQLLPGSQPQFHSLVYLFQLFFQPEKFFQAKSFCSFGEQLI